MPSKLHRKDWTFLPQPGVQRVFCRGSSQHQLVTPKNGSFRHLPCTAAASPWSLVGQDRQIWAGEVAGDQPISLEIGNEIQHRHQT